MVAEEVERMMDEIATLRRENGELKALVAELVASSRELHEEIK